jgi:simple sugar transport system ATP-binding protein
MSETAIRPTAETNAASTYLLEARGVSKRFGGVLALDKVDFRLAAGEVVALAGDNGAGKSTLIKIISGVFQASTGVLFFQGAPAHFDNPQTARDSGIETIYQDLALADNLDVGANVFLGREPVRRILGLPFVDRQRMRHEAAETLKTLDIELDRLDRPVRALSGGQRQCVAIGRALHWHARVLIMDEPTAALGVPEQRKVLALTRSLAQRGVGIIFISHNLQDIFSVSDRIVVLRRGALAGACNTAESKPDDIVKLMVGA